MKRTTITETKNNLSALIHAVRRGESVIITDRKKPVARIESISSASVEDVDSRLERLQREGVLMTRHGGDLDHIVTEPPVQTHSPVGALGALLRERSGGR